MKRLLTLLLALALACSILALPARAADPVTAEGSAQLLYDLGLFKGTGVKADGSPEFDLNRAPTRAEAVTMLVRLLGAEEQAMQSVQAMPFIDVPDWARPYVSYAYRQGLTVGVSPDHFGSYTSVTTAQYLTFVLRAMGYADGTDFSWSSAWTLTDKLGITGGEYNAKTAFLRGDAAVVSANALTADRDTIVTTEVGQHQMWAAQFLDTRRPRSFISSGGLGTMGFGFPAAIGAQAAYPDSLVVCLAGDGSFQMNSQEMATAKAAGLPVKVIIFDNQCLGMVRQWQQLFYHGRYSQTLFDDSIVNFVALGHAYGWHAAEVSDPAQLDEALKDLINSEGPALLNVQIAQSELVLPMVAPGSAIDESVAARNVAPTIMPEGKGE